MGEERRGGKGEEERNVRTELRGEEEERGKSEK